MADSTGMPFDDVAGWELELAICRPGVEQRNILALWLAQGGGRLHGDSIELPPAKAGSSGSAAIAAMASTMGLTVLSSGSSPPKVLREPLTPNNNIPSEATTAGQAKNKNMQLDLIDDFMQQAATPVRSRELKLRPQSPTKDAIDKEKLALLQIQRNIKENETISRRLVDKAIFTRFRTERDAWLNWASRAAPVIAVALGIDGVELAVLLEAAVREHQHELAGLASPMQGELRPPIGTGSGW